MQNSQRLSNKFCPNPMGPISNIDALHIGMRIIDLNTSCVTTVTEDTKKKKNRSFVVGYPLYMLQVSPHSGSSVQMHNTSLGEVCGAIKKRGVFEVGSVASFV